MHNHMKNLDFGCRKLFPFVLGLVMAVGCNKNEVSNDVVTGDEDSPVAISLSVGNPTYVSTKVALEEWNNSKLNVFGLRRKPTDVVGKGVYDFSDTGNNIVDYEVVAASNVKTGLDVYSNKEKLVPYFYSETHIYDFYGYHLGGAVASTPEIKEGDAYGFEVTFLGDNDLMYAHTDKADDIANSSATVKINEADLYSAWSARRGVHPTLVFDHALVRLNFIVQGKGDKYNTVRITGVDVNSVNKGYLTVTGANVGFVVDSEAEEVTMSLRTAGKDAFQAALVDPNTAGNHLGGEGACLMVAPGMTEIDLEIHMEHVVYEVPIESYKYTVKASDVEKKDENGNYIPVESFEAGLSYDFYVYVYGPEEIQIAAKVAEWEAGGTVVIDPDKPLSGGGSDDEGDDEGGSEGGDDSGEDDDDPVDQPVAVTGVSLDQTSLSMTEGDEVTLNATVDPADAADKSVTWKSNNDAVATVLYGVVTAVGEGEAIITVTTVDGGFTAECAVTVAALTQDSGNNEGVGEEEADDDSWEYED